jgi:hypothetical protein
MLSSMLSSSKALVPIKNAYSALDAFHAHKTGQPLGEPTELAWDKYCLVPKCAHAGDPDKVSRESLGEDIAAWLDELAPNRNRYPVLTNLRVDHEQATVWRRRTQTSFTRVHRLDRLTKERTVLDELPIPEEQDA